MNPWILTDDRLPPEGEVVLVCWATLDPAYPKRDVVRGWYKSHFGWNGEAHMGLMRPNWWMPLPKHAEEFA